MIPVSKSKLLKLKSHSSWWQIQVVLLHTKKTICAELYILVENRKSLKKCSPLDVIESVWSLHCRWFGTKLHHCDTQIQVAIYSNVSSYHRQHESSLWFCFDQSVPDSTAVLIFVDILVELTIVNSTNTSFNVETAMLSRGCVSQG